MNNDLLRVLRNRIEVFCSTRDFNYAKQMYDTYQDRMKARIYNESDRGYIVEISISDQYSFRGGRVNFQILDDRISYMHCNCGNFTYYSPCTHTIMAYYYLLDHPKYLQNPYYLHSFSRLYEIFSKEEETSFNRKLLKMDVVLSIIPGREATEVNLKIGENKLYSIRAKINSFFEAYRSPRHSSYTFGKELVYSNKKYRFTREDEKILEFFQERVENAYIPTSSVCLLNSQNFKEFLPLLKEKPFYVQILNHLYKIDEIQENFEIDSYLMPDEEGYRFFFHYQNFTNFTSDFEYVFQNGQLYHLTFEQRNLIKTFVGQTRGNALIFKEKDLSNFQTYFLPKLRILSQNIHADESLQKYVELDSPVNRLYFDYKRGKLLAEVKYFYPKKQLEIPRNSKIALARDVEKEKLAIRFLEDNDFQYQEKKDTFIMEDVEKQGLFLETKLKEIPEGFEFYLSSAVKKLNVMKTPTLSSGLSMGSDEWLRYDFQFEGLSMDDFKNIMASVKEQKKYIKLKSGTIIKLDKTEELNDFYDLLENFDIDYRKLDDFEFKIPKYKALYLDHYTEKDNYIKVNKSHEFLEFLNQFEEYKNSKMNITDSYDKMLRDYQVTGVNFLTSLAKCGFGGILADEMGLGKTFQAITYIKHRLLEDATRKFLIVVPTSLLYNWQDEFTKYAPNISVVIMNMLPSVRKEMFQKLDEYSVIITSYGLIRQDIEEYMNQTFDTCIIDEAQNIKNIHAGSTKSLKLISAKTKFALTGTPIENSLLELYSIFDFLMPGYFSTPSKFNERFQKPILKEESKERMEQLNMAVAPFILRRKKMDVLKDLPEKIERKITIDLKEEQKKVYYAHLELAKKEIQEEMDVHGFAESQIKILSILTRLRQICIDPSIFIESYHDGSSKIDAVLEFLETAIASNHKVLLFSQFTSALHILENKFHEEGISYYYLDGATKAKDRLQMVKQFNEDDTSVFLISLKAGGTGLNLTGADIVIHLDFWWNPAVENQATDRAHRIGQKKVVEVVKFVCQGTIEERVLELQDKKKKLSDGILEQKDRDQIILSKLTEKDIKKLLDMEE